MKKKIIFIGVVSLLILIASCNQRQTKTATMSQDTESALKEEGSSESGVMKLKVRIDSAKMIEYTDKTYNVTVFYPDFFQDSDTTENGTARFNYPDDINREISLIMFVEPNVDGWSVKEAVKHLSDSLNHCVKEGDNYFIMSGQLDGSAQFLFLEKCFLIDNKWVDYTLYYHSQHKEAIGRLVDLLMAWEPNGRK